MTVLASQQCADAAEDGIALPFLVWAIITAAATQSNLPPTPSRNTCRASTAPNPLHLPLHACPKLQSPSLQYTHNMSKVALGLLYIMLHHPRAPWASGKCVGGVGAHAGADCSSLRAFKSWCWIDTGSWLCFLRLCVAGVQTSKNLELQGVVFLRCGAVSWPWALGCRCLNLQKSTKML